MLQTLKNAWNTKEIRSKIFFTLFILLLYRIGTVIPVPFVEANNFSNSFSRTIVDYLNTLSGGSLGTATLFALGVSPYINASIIIQLLAVVFPKLGELAKNDKQKMNFITRIVTVVLAIVTAIGYYWLLKNNGALTNSATPGNNSMFWFYGIVIVACYCAGASMIMWMAEKINEFGIGNGISMILFANIISRVPYLAGSIWTLVFTNGGFSGFSFWGLILAIVCLAVIVAVIMLIICVTNSERRIPIQYAKRVVGRKMYGGQGTNLPLKVNMTGVMPIIFASSIASLPATLAAFFPKVKWLVWIAKNFSYDTWIYVFINLILIIAFSYFYVMISFNPVEVANNIKDNGGSIPGIRPGKPTAEYIKKVLNRITTIGAIFLCFISCFPMIVAIIAGYFKWNIQGIAQLAFGGTSLLIVIGVALETVRELEAQMTLRNYKGFLD
jgi:preprotein translocase subunit SecY